MIDKAQRANRRGELDAEIDSRYIQIANEFALLVAARINQLGTPINTSSPYSTSWEYRRRWVSDHSSSGFLRISSTKKMSSSDRRLSPSFCALDLSNNGRLTGSPAVMIVVGRSGHSSAASRPSRPISIVSLRSGSSKFSNFASILTKVNDNSHAGASLKISENVSELVRARLEEFSKKLRAYVGWAIFWPRITYVDSISLQSAQPSAFERFIDLWFPLQYDCSDCRRVKSRLRPPVCLNFNPLLFALSLLLIDLLFNLPDPQPETSLHQPFLNFCSSLSRESRRSSRSSTLNARA